MNSKSIRMRGLGKEIKIVSGGHHDQETLLTLTLTFPQQFEINGCNLLLEFLCLSVRAQAVLDLFHHLAGNLNLAHLSVPPTDRENHNRAVALSFTLFAKAATGLIAAHHAG